ncbi:MAG: HD domain-containing protein [Deltaproteobacteria bacterium]|nr:HD domain-containing protein [Deltaproteobacteria bacterium]
MKPRVFRDPVHGLIGFGGKDAKLSRILDTRAVQRLRKVRQMGFAWLVYPGAEHSRFGHAMGAFHVAGRVTTHLGLSEDVARDVKAAALLHDLGHGPFSHAWEVALGGDSHEDWGRRIVLEDDELRAALCEVSEALPSALDDIFRQVYRPQVARKLVSSQLDVDRMDYLLRDAHYSGVGYSTFDLEWVIHALGVQPVRGGADPNDLVIDFRRGMHAVEQYLFGRSYMYAQVYYHKTVRAAEWMFLALMRRFAELCRAGDDPPGLAVVASLARGERISVEDYLTLDDARVACAMDDWARGGVDPILADLAARLSRRRLFKTIEAGEDPAVADRLAPALEEAARRAMGSRASYYWSIDRAERLGYAARPGEEIFVVGHPRHGTVNLGELVREMPLGRQAFTVRVVCAPELLEAFTRVVGARMSDSRPRTE